MLPSGPAVRPCGTGVLMPAAGLLMENVERDWGFAGLKLRSDRLVLSENQRLPSGPAMIRNGWGTLPPVGVASGVSETLGVAADRLITPRAAEEKPPPDFRTTSVNQRLPSDPIARLSASCPPAGRAISPLNPEAGRNNPM